MAAGCGSSNDDNSSSSGTGTTAAGGELTATPGINVAKDDAIAGAAADAVQQSGQLSVASDATYPPMEFFAKDNSTTVIGADADISKALGQIMGLQAKRPEHSVRQHPAGPDRRQVRPRDLVVHGHHGSPEDE